MISFFLFIINLSYIASLYIIFNLYCDWACVTFYNDDTKIIERSIGSQGYDVNQTFKESFSLQKKIRIILYNDKKGMGISGSINFHYFSFFVGDLELWSPDNPNNKCYNETPIISSSNGGYFFDDGGEQKYCSILFHPGGLCKNQTFYIGVGAQSIELDFDYMYSKLKKNINYN